LLIAGDFGRFNYFLWGLERVLLLHWYC
jgi:hypothetical protein